MDAVKRDETPGSLRKDSLLLRVISSCQRVNIYMQVSQAPISTGQRWRGSDDTCIHMRETLHFMSSRVRIHNNGEWACLPFVIFIMLESKHGWLCPPTPQAISVSQGCSLYQRPWKGGQEKRAVNASFARHTETQRPHGEFISNSSKQWPDSSS